ncbi:stage V sporulation protein K [Chlamydia abortus]|nr:stage V sporulation protein K [Chlamydia abortus]
MEDYKNQFVLILAGYPDEMDEFMRTNPGLPSRFPIQVDFPDYTVEQLMQIAHWMMKEREYSFHPQAEWKLKQYLTREIENSFGTFSNARLVRNLIEKAMRHQAVRLLQLNKQHPSRQELMTLRPEDLRLDRA